MGFNIVKTCCNVLEINTILWSTVSALDMVVLDLLPAHVVVVVQNTVLQLIHHCLNCLLHQLDIIIPSFLQTP